MLGEGKVYRQGLLARTDLERHAVIVQEQTKLLEIVGTEEVGTRQRRLVGAWPRDEAVAQTRIRAGHGRGVDTDKRIACTYAMSEALAGNEALQRFVQEGNGLLMDDSHLLQRRNGVMKVEWSDERWRKHESIRKTDEQRCRIRFVCWRYPRDSGITRRDAAWRNTATFGTMRVRHPGRHHARCAASWWLALTCASMELPYDDS